MKAKNEFKEGKHNTGYVSHSFLEKFGDMNLTGGGIELAYKDLPRDMYDREINAELGVEEVALDDVLYMIKHDLLKKSGYSNIFYFGGFVVNVHWDSGDAGWYVSDWRLDDGIWRAGNRVFSRNWNSDPQNTALTSSDPLGELEKRVAALEEWRASVKDQLL